MLYPEKFGGMYDGGDEAPEFSVPEEYQNEGWTKDLKSNADVWTKLAGSEKLIGQKVEGKIDLLKEDSSPEEANTYYKAIGRPDEAKGYLFDRDGQSEQLQSLNSDEVDNAVKDIFHKFGLTNKQATGIQKDYEALFGAQIAEQLESAKKYDSDFDEATIKAFGNDKEAIIESSRILLEKFAPEGFDEHIKNLDNESLTVLAGVLNNLRKSYISEDAFSNLTGGSGGGTGGESEEALRAEARKLMSSEEWTDPFNPRNKEVRKTVEELYKKIGEME
jgi:hypothetical protein